MKLTTFSTPTLRRLLIIMLGLSLADGIANGYATLNHGTVPAWWEVGATIAMALLGLSWYHLDSNFRQFQRSMGLNILIFGIALIGFPYYLIRSRPAGKKLASLGWLTAYCGLLLLTGWLGEQLMKWFV